MLIENNLSAGFLVVTKSNIARIILLVAVYFILSQTRVEIPAKDYSAILLPGLSAGFAFSVLLIFGIRLWPGILLGALLSNFVTGLHPIPAIGLSLGSTAEAFVGAYLLTRYTNFNVELRTLQDIFHLLLVGVLVSAMIGAANGTFWLLQQGWISWSQAASTFKWWWMGDMLGVLLVAPSLIGIVYPSKFNWTPKVRKQAVFLFASLAFLCLMIFTNFGMSMFGYQPQAYILLPFIVWIALRFDMNMLSVALLAIYLGSFFSLSTNAGLYMLSIESASNNAWTFNVAACFIGLIVLVASDQRNRNFAIKEQAIRANLKLATHDVLTGLPNRSFLHNNIQQALVTARRDGKNLSLLFLGLDRFKNLNNSMGYGVGDKLLQAVSERLLISVRGGDTVSRIGGDEFIILLSETGAEGVAHVSGKILKQIAVPYEIDGTQISTQASIGISVFPGNADDADSLIKYANVAMYRAKDLGRNNFQFFTPELNFTANHLFSMEKDLRLALERGELSLHYQPKADLVSGRICGAEALIRWNHPVRGFVSPAEFIPVAEETGQIIPIGEWVLRTACAQLAEWRKQGIMVFPVAINLSIRQLRQANLAKLISTTIEQAGLHPSDLELEITEGIMMDGAQAAMGFLREMRELGVQLSIDDFGTGYSSLSYLKKLPVDTLKIDQSFVRDIDADDSDAAIVRAIIILGHQFNLQVIAEGVETVGQLDFLRARGCNEMQGYYFSRPLPAWDFYAFVNSNPRLA